MVRNRNRLSSLIAPYEIYNVENYSPIKITEVIRLIENGLGKKVKINFQPLKPGDIKRTYADIDDLIKDIICKPKTPFKYGNKSFINWFVSFYK